MFTVYKLRSREILLVSAGERFSPSAWLHILRYGEIPNPTRLTIPSPLLLHAHKRKINRHNEDTTAVYIIPHKTILVLALFM